jgi:uncharacterized protein with PQ loop repeat
MESPDFEVDPDSGEHVGLSLLAGLAIAMGILAFIPAIVRVIRTESSCDVSRLAIILRIGAAGLWLWYGLAAGVQPTVIYSLLAFVMLLVFLWVDVRYAHPADVCEHLSRLRASHVPLPRELQPGHML